MGTDSGKEEEVEPGERTSSVGGSKGPFTHMSLFAASMSCSGFKL